MHRALLIIGVLYLACAEAPQVAGAQSTPAALPAGIAVVGRGVVRTHADSLKFVATLFAVNSRTATLPAPDLDAAATAIAKSLKDAGVSDAVAGIAGFNPTAPRTVSGTLRKPTRDIVLALFEKGNAAALPFPGVGLQNISFGLLVDDCSAAETRAEAAAFADARARAQRTALAAGVRLGGIISVNEAPAIGSNGVVNCATRPDTQTNLYQNFGPLRTDIDDATNGDVYVTVTATVTYSIER